MRRPWWLFFGVAREVERHRYYTDVELFGRALARMALAFNAASRAIVEAMTPAINAQVEAIRQFGAALNRSLAP